MHHYYWITKNVIYSEESSHVANHIYVSWLMINGAFDLSAKDITFSLNWALDLSAMSYEMALTVGSLVS